MSISKKELNLYGISTEELSNLSIEEIIAYYKLFHQSAILFEGFNPDVKARLEKKPEMPN